MQFKKMAISVTGLRKSFHAKEVLKGVTFSVRRGTIFALLGSNGAGKTTTVRILTTQLPADGGNVLIEGYDAAKDSREVRRHISVTGQFSAIDESLTAKENLILIGRLRRLPEPEKTARELLSAFSLSDAANRAVSTYSGGMKRKLDIAMSLVGDSEVLFLDEPTTGLDPQSRCNMWNMIRELKRRGVTIFLTTQYLEEAEQLADRIAILDKGVILAEGTPSELKSYLPHGIVKFSFGNTQDLETAAALLSSYRVSAQPENCRMTVFTDGCPDSLAQIFHLLAGNRIHIEGFSEFEPNLEDVFLTMIGEKEELSDGNKL